MTVYTQPERRARLVALGLQNFQTIQEYQELRFRRLTFLYGPNSAGKSALIDAINVARRLWSNLDPGDTMGRELPYFWGDMPARSLTLSPHWRRLGSEDLNNLRVDVEFSASRESFEPVGDKLVERETYHDQVGWRLKYCAGDDDDVEVRLSAEFSPAALVCMEIEIAREPLVRLQRDTLSFNIDHVFFSLVREGQSHKLSEAIEEAEQGGVFVLNGGWLATTFDVYLLEDRRIDRELIVESGPRGHSYDDEQMASHVRGIEASTGFLRCVEFFEALQQALGRAARLALTINQVSASRQIPEREQLTYLLNRFGQPIEDPDHYGSLEKYGITTTGENIYVPLVSACVRNALAAAAPRLRAGGLEGEEQSMLNAVNDALRHHLVVDVDKAYQPPAYQLAVDFRLIVAPESLQGLAGQESGDTGYFWDAILACLQLVDETGLRLGFHDVGSGIGYVLPVLVTAHTATRSFIQQPELHLHPALQSALADIFIEATRRDRMAIVESHSEHILLRLLRRVRQTSAGRLEGSELEVNPEEVAIYFFEPTATRATRIRHLRVTTEGDFMDRWPGGFFAERDRELFDE